MAIGERIRYFRNKCGMTLKYLGLKLGFPEKSADVRLAQYETGNRTPKSDLTAALANTFNISPHALTVPDIDNEIGLMHTLFALEDLYGISIDTCNDTISFKIDPEKSKSLLPSLEGWLQKAEEYNSGQISKDEYDNWRYNFPEFDTTQRWVQTPPIDLTDVFQDRLDD